MLPGDLLLSRFDMLSNLILALQLCLGVSRLLSGRRWGSSHTLLSRLEFSIPFCPRLPLPCRHPLPTSPPHCLGHLQYCRWLPLTASRHLPLQALRVLYQARPFRPYDGNSSSLHSLLHALLWALWSRTASPYRRPQNPQRITRLVLSTEASYEIRFKSRGPELVAAAAAAVRQLPGGTRQ